MSQRRDLIIRIDGDTRGFEQRASSAEKSAKAFERELAKLEAQQAKTHAQMTRVGQGMLAGGAAIAVGLGMAARAAIQWESAFAGVKKTADTDDPLRLAKLEEQLRTLARTLPASHTEIAAVAEAAGQLGISTGDVAAFTRVMVDLGETTNLTADEAATALAQFSNIMGTASVDVDRLGSTLVELGNNGASTERDIVEMALRIAGAGKQVGLAESDVFAMASTLASLGIEAEAGGSAISTFISDLSASVATGSSDLQGFADVAGMSVEEFSRLFQQDAARAVAAFTDGLGRVQDSGGSAIVTLEDLGIEEKRMRDTILRLAGAQGLLTEQIDLGGQAWSDNTALVEEARKRYETTEARIQIARSSLNDFAIDLGNVALPALAAMADGVTELSTALGGLPGVVKTGLVVLAGVASAVSITGGAALIAVPKIVAYKAALVALNETSPDLAKNLGKLSTALKATAVAGAVLGLTAAVGMFLDSLATDGPAIDEMTKSLLELGRTGQATGALVGAFGDDLAKLGETIDLAGKNKLVDALGFVNPDGWSNIETARRQLESLDTALASLVESGRMDLAAVLHGKIADAAEEQGVSQDELSERLGGYAAALAGANAMAEAAAEVSYRHADAVGGVSQKLGTAYDSLGAFAEAQGYSEEQTKELVQQVDAWGDALARFVEPLGAYTDKLAEKEDAERKRAQATADATESEKDSWEDYVQTVGVSVDEYLAELQKQVDAQSAWQSNMTMLAGKVSQTTLDELARMGPEGAPLVAQLVGASAEQLAQLDDLFARHTRDATGAMAGELYLAQVLLPQIASKVGQGTAIALATALANGTTTVAQIAQDYASVLAGGVNPLLESLGRRRISLQHAAVAARNPGRTYTGYATGGIEDHVAQIADGGPGVRIWAEAETGGEAYIPLPHLARTDPRVPAPPPARKDHRELASCR